MARIAQQRNNRMTGPQLPRDTHSTYAVDCRRRSDEQALLVHQVPRHVDGLLIRDPDCIVNEPLRHGEVAGQAVDAYALDDGVDLVALPLAFLLRWRVHDVVFDLVEES